jgi:hypothetical protein
VPERKIKFQQQPGGPFFEGYEVGIRESTERWTEMTLEDGSVLRVKPMTVGAIRIDGQWDQSGNPVYALKGGPNISTLVSVPEHLKKPTPESVPKKAN